MSKKSSIIFISAIVILLTFSFFMYDIITAYNIEKISDDISMGMLGVAFRISFVFPIIIAEISVLFDIVFLLSWWGICGIFDDEKWINVCRWNRLSGFVWRKKWARENSDFWNRVRWNKCCSHLSTLRNHYLASIMIQE